MAKPTSTYKYIGRHGAWEPAIVWSQVSIFLSTPHRDDNSALSVCKLWLIPEAD